MSTSLELQSIFFLKEEERRESKIIDGHLISCEIWLLQKIKEKKIDHMASKLLVNWD